MVYQATCLREKKINDTTLSSLNIYILFTSRFSITIDTCTLDFFFSTFRACSGKLESLDTLNTSSNVIMADSFALLHGISSTSIRANVLPLCLLHRGRFRERRLMKYMNLSQEIKASLPCEWLTGSVWLHWRRILCLSWKSCRRITVMDTLLHGCRDLKKVKNHIYVLVLTE